MVAGRRFAIPLVLAGVLAWLVHAGTGTAPAASVQPECAAAVTAQAPPPMHAPPGLPSAPRDGSPAGAPASPAPPWLVRVVLRVDGVTPGQRLPAPELLRLDERGVAWPVGESAPPDLEPASTAAAGRAETSRTFEVGAPGRYVAAWHVWRQVPGTRTWRVQRGRGPELLVSGRQPGQQVVVPLRAAELELDPELEARNPGAGYRITAKDGD